MRRRRALGNCLVLLMLLGLPVVGATEQQPFDNHSLDTIEQRYAGERFLLVLWSVDCAPCRDELRLLGELRREYPLLNIVLVATDDIVQRATLERILAGQGLGDADTWIFAEADVERLRHGIDPEWFGELPRSYFYDAAANRRSVSGRLSADAVTDWLLD